ncbi:hypothetical protein [Halobellus salinisoli]|uniref:hypothetical protein n=1 Tax=Halobellus salinisoli TaxID=3108500 RepID=UPI003009B598
MSTERVSVEELRSRVEQLDIDLQEGTTAGYHHYQTDFALGSIEIAYGEDRAVYDESTFPGVVYASSDPEATVLTSGNGTIGVLDAEDEDAATAAIEDAVETLKELYLLDEEQPIELEIPATEMPFASDPPEVKTLGGAPDEQ